jgi:rod shape-determining protein MreD
VKGPAKVAAKVLVVLAVGLFAQLIFAPDLRLHEVAPDFLLLLAVSAGFTGGKDLGAVAGFAAGLAADLFLQSTPFGLSALAFCLAAYAVGWAQANLFHPRLALVPVAAAGGTVLGVALFVVIGYIVGQEQLVAPGKTWLVEQAVIEGCWAAVFSLPAVAAMGWALRPPAAREPAVPAAASSELPLPAHRARPMSPRPRRRHRPRTKVR